MKKALTTFILGILCSFQSISQGITDHIIVKFNYVYLDYDVINNKEIKTIRLQQLFNADGKKELKNMTPILPNVGSYTVSKLFPHYGTKDSLSISRTGEIISVPPFWAIFLLEIPDESNYHRILTAFDRNTKLVDYAHPDYVVELQSVPNDTLYARQYALNGLLPDAHINIEEAWDIETGEPFIKVAVHDNGIDSLHPDLNVVFGGGYNQSAFPEDNWGFAGIHGTPVAGIIAAKRNNETGIAGIAGGDGSDTTGCSLIDIRYAFGVSLPSSYFMAGVVDAARSVGSYWDYPDGSNTATSEYFNSAPGFGVHIGNHSYTIKTVPPAVVTEGKIPGPDSDPEEVFQCQMCTEAFLFSYLNGVVNVVARGNRGVISPETDPTIVEDLFPQNVPDNWIISVGASGYDGLTVQEGLNQSPQEVISNFYSLYGGNMDLIAPGSDSIVYTTMFNSSNNNSYTKFNGTSAATPHVTGVAALILSHYNKACYNRRNLAIEDVEYLLEKSATDLYGSGYDDTTGWGRLNAGEALKMIENPSKQIIHPDSLLLSEIVARDTIALYYHQRLWQVDWGPISSPWPLERERHYQVERIKVENTYTFDEYILPTTQILDYWVRPSGSNALEFYIDTIRDTVNFPQPNLSILRFDTINLNPYVEIVDFDTLSHTFKTTGYYYHFIARYDANLDDVFPNQLTVIGTENYWYPTNIDSTQAKLPLSIYIQDTTLISIYDFPCDADNPLYDEDFEYLGLEMNISQEINVYPNPFNESIVIDFGSLEGPKYITMRDLHGKLIISDITDNGSYQFETKILGSGIYFLTCTSEKGIFTFKLIKP